MVEHSLAKFLHWGTVNSEIHIDLFVFSSLLLYELVIAVHAVRPIAL